MLLFLHRLLKDAVTFCTFEKIQELMMVYKKQLLTAKTHKPAAHIPR
jgi:hypothetical protein